MTNEEYHTWYRQHVAAFPGISTWLGKQTQSQQPEIMRKWMWTLRNCDYNDCIQATNAMHGNALYQGSYEGHPATIKQIAWGRKRDRSTWHADRTQTVSCKRCNDCGRIPVWSADAIKTAMADGSIDDVFSGVIGYATCDCSAAIGLSKEGERDPNGFNPRIHRACSLTPDDAEFNEMKSVVKQMQNCEPVRQDSYQPDESYNFDAGKSAGGFDQSF